MSGTLKIAGTVGPITIVADVRHGILHLATNVGAPTDGRPATRVNWLTRQLPDDAPKELRIEAWGVHARQPVAALLTEAREDPSRLADEQGRDLRMFRLTWATRLGTKRGVDRGSVVGSVVAGIDAFYEYVVQNLRPWATHTPKLPREMTLGEAGIDVTTSDPEFDDVAGPEGTIGGADRDVARDDDVDAESEVEQMPTDEELAEWLAIATGPGDRSAAQVPVADEQVTVDLGDPVADVIPSTMWAPPSDVSPVLVPLPPPSMG